MPALLTEAKATRIRAATLADIPRVVEMGLQMAEETAYTAHLAVNSEALAALAIRLITGGDDLTLLLLDCDDVPVAMLGLMVYAHPMSGERIASEACWYVRPEARGGIGLRLWRVGEQWARNRGAVALLMIQPHSADRVGVLYARAGYGPVETTWMRRF